MHLLPESIHRFAGAFRYLVPLAAACALLLSGAAGAASLQVAPTSVVLDVDANAGALWLSNTDPNTSTRAQVRVFRWTQVDGEDVLEPTRDLAVSPPMLELDPSGRQLVRVVRIGVPPQDVEASYRIIVDEVPNDAGDKPSGLQFLLRYSLPVFIAPTGSPQMAYELDGRLELEGKQPTLVVSNRGNQHAQLADLSWVGPGGERSQLVSGLVGYVLPGQTMSWPLEVPPSRVRGDGELRVRINGEALDRPLPLDAAAR